MHLDRGLKPHLGGLNLERRAKPSQGRKLQMNIILHLSAYQSKSLKSVLFSCCF